ncbi:melanoma-associated antigen B4-like [Manis pentadactyla]|uniref:melanoma-associated antigen B4-like n=1 Tax=Manis pentadactyla TaxID=143292 RepID=UPI00187673CF|nr:melanoma-associated antigen B4-like [Manis pentadactyla]
MPRGQNTKRRAREKRRQTTAVAQALSAQATAVEEEETTSSSSPVAGISQQPEKAEATASAVAGVSHPESDQGAKGQAEESETSSQASASIESTKDDPLTRRVEMLVQLLLSKYKMKEFIKKVDMIKLINKRYREHFPEILSRAVAHVELVFGLELKKVRPNGGSYTFVSKLNYLDGSPSSGWELTRHGILMPLLSMIFLNGNRASREQVLQFLNMLGNSDGRKHFIFRDPRKLITELVEQNFLEYRHVRNSPIPCSEFLWGPSAHAITNKMQVLDLVAKVNGSTPTAFPQHYNEALRDEKERALATVATMIGIPVRPCARSKATSSYQ